MEEVGTSMQEIETRAQSFIRIEHFRRNPLVSLPFAWNELPDELRFQHNRTTFKIALNDYLFEKITSA